MHTYLRGGIFPDSIVTAEDWLNTCDLLWACAQRIFYQKCGNELEHLQRLQERTLQLRSLFSFYEEARIGTLVLWIKGIQMDTDPGFWWPKIGTIPTTGNFLYFLSKKIAIYLSPGLLKTSKLQDNPSALRREHPALQKLKLLTFFNFCG
jgi:hypothetical protein